MYVHFFFNDTATTEIYTLSLHDALPIFLVRRDAHPRQAELVVRADLLVRGADLHRTGVYLRLRRSLAARSEEHTSELQSRQYLVCRLLLEKKKKRLLCEQYLN